MRAVKKITVFFLRISISIGVLAFLFRQIHPHSLLAVIKDADPLFLFLALALTFAGYALCFFRWDMLLVASGVSIPTKRLISAFCGGIFFGMFLPSTIGVDLVRTLDLSKETKKPGVIVASVLLDRISGYAGMAFVSIPAIVFGLPLIKNPIILWSFFLLFAVLTGILLLIFNKSAYFKISKFLHVEGAGRTRLLLRNIHHEMHLIRAHKDVIRNNLLLSIVLQALSPLTMYCIAVALGVRTNMLYFFIFVPIISSVALLPVSIGGLGLRDYTSIFFFALAGISKDIAFAMSLLTFVYIVVFSCLGGIVYVFTVHHRRI